MKKINLTTSFTVFDNLNELSEELKNLFNEAIKVRNTAYAPYSKFQVGCAILLDNNKIVTGSNQENAAYPSGLCAERVAIYSAASQYPKSKIVTIVISARSENKIVDKAVAPCGACRQSIAEYETKQDKAIQIYFSGETGDIIKADSLKDLLPLGFDKTYL